MPQALKTLFQALQTSTYLTSNNITMVFGEEEIDTQRTVMPYVVMVARGGSYDEPAYAAFIDPATEMLWNKYETVEFWLRAASTDLSQQGAIDHTDALESLRQMFLSAVRDQRAQYTDVSNVAYGLFAKPLSGRWETVGQNADSRYGRVYVLTCQVNISIVMNSPAESVINTVAVIPSVVNKPAT